jgi:Chitin binding Peritrophin-A domain
MFVKILVSITVFQIASGQEKDPRCPPYNEGLVVHLPHEYDCTKFYKCDWGVPKLFDCRPGLHFSVETDRCEYPGDANCEFYETTTRQITSTKATTTTTRSAVTTTSRTTSTIPPPVGSRCPADDDPFNNPIFLPHEYDCALFYMCFFGDLILYECSTSGKHWSVELNKCEVPELANCEFYEKTTVTLPTTTTPPTTTSM